MKNLRGTITILRRQLQRQLEDGSLKEAFNLINQEVPKSASLESFDMQINEQTTWPKKVSYWKIFKNKPAKCTSFFYEGEE